MRAAVRALYIPVVFTMMGVGCANRTAHVVANSLSEARYNQPKSNAYDTKAWAKTMADRDRARGERIATWKQELFAKAHLNFFPAADKIFREGFRVDAWDAADRAMIRDYLGRILKATRKRRAFDDREELAADEAQARRILNYFNRYDRQSEV